MVICKNENCTNEVKLKNGQFCSRDCFHAERKGKKQSPESNVKRSVTLKERCKYQHHSLKEKFFDKLVENLSLRGFKLECTLENYNGVTRERYLVACNKCGNKFKASFDNGNSRKFNCKVCNPYRHGQYQRKKMSNAHKKLWKDPVYATKQMKAQGVSPNKQELFLNNLLQKWFPNEWKFVGDGKMWINGKCPDFIHKEKKLLIEYFGEHWHPGGKEEELARVKLFEPDYRTLVIRDYELKDVDKLREKINDFMSCNIGGITIEIQLGTDKK